MDLLQEKQPFQYNEDIKKLISIFKFRNLEIELKGSSSLANIHFYGDYDFYTRININLSAEEVYDEFNKILRSIIENNNTYFIEFKIQNKDGSKFKFFPNDNFKLSVFAKHFNKNTDYCKLDIVYFSNNRFIEASCIYSFYGKKLTPKEYIKELELDVEDLKKENNYFKILKRLFSIYKIKGNQNKIDLLIKVFNSNLGQDYKKIANVEAIDLVKEYYNKEALTKKRIEVNLDELGYNKKAFSKMKQMLNRESKKIYKELT